MGGFGSTSESTRSGQGRPTRTARPTTCACATLSPPLLSRSQRGSSYLNKTCYNGLYRVNSNGKFNVPEGRYNNPDICNADRLREASQALQNVTICVGDFASIVQPGRSDLVYCDPPYDGVFTSYQASGFRGSDQERLRNAANAWMRSGTRVVLSNADTPAMRKLYSGFRVHEATAPRHINSKSTDRGNAAELIITSE